MRRFLRLQRPAFAGFLLWRVSTVARRFSDEELSQIEVAYKTSGKAVNALAKEFDLPETTLRRLIKTRGWVQDATGRKRSIVADHFAGSAGGLANGELRQSQEDAAREDIADMQAGLDVARACIRKLGAMIDEADDPRDIKIIVEANKGAIETIRRIRGLDEVPANPIDVSRIERVIVGAPV